MKELRYRVEGPVVREGLPSCPMFLIVVGGMDRWADERRRKRVRRAPAFYLVSAVQQAGEWRLTRDRGPQVSTDGQLGWRGNE